MYKNARDYFKYLKSNWNFKDFNKLEFFKNYPDSFDSDYFQYRHFGLAPFKIGEIKGRQQGKFAEDMLGDVLTNFIHRNKLDSLLDGVKMLSTIPEMLPLTLKVLYPDDSLELEQFFNNTRQIKSYLDDIISKVEHAKKTDLDYEKFIKPAWKDIEFNHSAGDFEFPDQNITKVFRNDVAPQLKSVFPSNKLFSTIGLKNEKEISPHLEEQIIPFIESNTNAL